MRGFRDRSGVRSWVVRIRHAGELRKVRECAFRILIGSGERSLSARSTASREFAPQRDSPYNLRRESFRDATGLLRCQCHHASAAGGDGGDAPVLDGGVRERFVDSSCRARRRARPWTERARRWREFFNCREAEVVFNSGGTEGDNTAIFGLLRAGDHFITTSIEHSAVLRAADRVAERGVEVTFVAPQEGWADRSGRDSSRDRPATRPDDSAGPDQRDAGK